jgi:hypothetical protein
VRAVAEAEGAAAPRRRAVFPSLVRSGLLRYALDVPALATAFTSVEAQITGWSVEKVHRYGRGGELRLISDAVLTLPEHPGRRLPTALLVELDRATMSADRLVGELGAYAWERDYPGNAEPYSRYKRCPPVLAVLTNAADQVLVRRAYRLAKAVAARERYFEALDIGVAILADLIQEGPLNEVVMPLDDPGTRIGVHQLARHEYPTGDGDTGLRR